MSHLVLLTSSMMAISRFVSDLADRLNEVASVSVVSHSDNYAMHIVYWPKGVMAETLINLVADEPTNQHRLYSYFGSIRESQHELQRAANHLLKLFSKGEKILVLYDRTTASVLFEHSKELGLLLNQQECFELTGVKYSIVEEILAIGSWVLGDDEMLRAGEIRGAALLRDRDEAIAHLNELRIAEENSDSRVRRRERLLSDMSDMLQSELMELESSSDDDDYFGLLCFAYTVYSCYLRSSLLESPGALTNSSPLITVDKTVIFSWFRTGAAAETKEYLLIEGPPGVEIPLLVDHYISLVKLRFGDNIPVVKVDLSSIPCNLLNFELFGYEASEDCIREGMIESAEGGIIVLEELHTASIETQAAIRDFMRHGTFRRTGSNRSIHLSTTVIATISDSVALLLSEKRIHQDLIKSFAAHVHIPGLCERTKDLPFLVEYFLPDSAEELSDEQRDNICKMHWERNVDELSAYMKFYPLTFIQTFLSTGTLGLRKGVEYGLHRAIDALIANHNHHAKVSVRDEFDALLFRYLHARYEGSKAAVERATGIKSSTISDQWDRLNLGHRRQSGMKSASSEPDSED